MKIIDKLCELYNSNKINYNFDDNVVLEYDDKDFIDYEIDISLNKQEDKYLIFIFIEQGQKLIFKGLLDHTVLSGMEGKYCCTSSRSHRIRQFFQKLIQYFIFCLCIDNFFFQAFLVEGKNRCLDILNNRSNLRILLIKSSFLRLRLFFFYWELRWSSY